MYIVSNKMVMAKSDIGTCITHWIWAAGVDFCATISSRTRGLWCSNDYAGHVTDRFSCHLRVFCPIYLLDGRSLLVVLLCRSTSLRALRWSQSLWDPPAPCRLGRSVLPLATPLGKSLPAGWYLVDSLNSTHNTNTTRQSSYSQRVYIRIYNLAALFWRIFAIHILPR